MRSLALLSRNGSWQRHRNGSGRGTAQPPGDSSGTSCTAPTSPGAAPRARGLRHAFGVGTLQSGVPLNLVQRWLGHARIRTTAIYIGAIGPEEVTFAGCLRTSDVQFWNVRDRRVGLRYSNSACFPPINSLPRRCARRSRQSSGLTNRGSTVRLKTAQGGGSWVSPCRPSPARQ
jgi:hypothetical protein